MKKLEKIRLSNETEETLYLEEALKETEENKIELKEGEEEKWYKKYFSNGKFEFKIKPFPWKSLNLKNAIIAGCLVLIVLAGYVNIIMTDSNLPSDDTLNTSPVITLPVSNPSDSEPVNVEENYFAVALINRERVRDEALEMLQTIIQNSETSAESRENAYSEMTQIANEVACEINIENLIKAKGFEECVAIVNGENANVVVKSDGLTAGQVAQIKEIVYLQSSILPENIKIIEKSV